MKNSPKINKKKSFKKAMKLGKNKTPLGMQIQKFSVSGKGIGA